MIVRKRHGYVALCFILAGLHLEGVPESARMDQPAKPTKFSYEAGGRSAIGY